MNILLHVFKLIRAYTKSRFILNHKGNIQKSIAWMTEILSIRPTSSKVAIESILPKY